MYSFHPELKSLPHGPQNVVAIIESINTPMVAAESRPLEPSQAYIVGMRTPAGTFSIYVYLYLSQSRDCLVYLHEPPEIPMASYHQFELEALQFVESMGFMVDNVNFRGLDAAHQQELLGRLPVFQTDLVAYARAVESEREGGEEEVLSDGEVMELEEVAEVESPPAALEGEELQKIARLLSSF